MVICGKNLLFFSVISVISGKNLLIHAAFFRVANHTDVAAPATAKLTRAVLFTGSVTGGGNSTIPCSQVSIGNSGGHTNQSRGNHFSFAHFKLPLMRWQT